MRRILIIGGGASGVLAALHLLSGNSDVLVSIIEARAELGRGLAYSTLDEGHVLNVRTGNMSAFPDDPEHFTRWLAARTEGESWDALSAFVPRQLFGLYLCDLLTKHGDATGRLKIIQGYCMALSVENEIVMARLADGTTLQADQAILATGNEAMRSASLNFTDPWSTDLEHSIAPDESLLIVGSGLTMIDFVISLRRQGHRGPINVVSRRGLTPRVHASAQAKVYGLSDLPVRISPATMLAWLRKEVRLAERNGSDWRSVMDGIRPYTQWLWQTMSLKSRRQFLRHARPWWDIHRHRMAPHVAAEFQSAVAAGQVRLFAGKLLSAQGSSNGIRVEFWIRGRRQVETLTVDHAVQCTGIGADPFASSNPLIRHLLATGLARADTLGLGLEVTRECAIIDRGGVGSNQVFAVGPITREAFWEITAIPDIRNQCALLANRLSLKSRQKRTVPLQGLERSKSWEEAHLRLAQARLASFLPNER